MDNKKKLCYIPHVIVETIFNLPAWNFKNNGIVHYSYSGYLCSLIKRVAK